jgi:hypothetical protein
MSINKMTTFSTLAAVYRRASSVVFTTPAEGLTPFVRFAEEDVISDALGTRYSPASSSLFADIDVSDAAEFVLYDTSGAVDDNPEFNETSIADLMAMDNDRAIDLPVKGSFTNQDIADLLFSMYIHLSEQRANDEVEPELVEEPDGGTE